MDRIRRWVGEATQTRIVLGEINAPVRTHIPINSFFDELFVLAGKSPEFSAKDQIGIEVFTGLDLEKTNLVGSKNHSPDKIYTDGSFAISLLFPDLKGNPEARGLDKIKKIEFRNATYVGWISHETKKWPVFRMGISENSPYLKEIINNLGLSPRIQVKFTPYFRG